MAPLFQRLKHMAPLFQREVIYKTNSCSNFCRKALFHSGTLLTTALSAPGLATTGRSIQQLLLHLNCRKPTTTCFREVPDTRHKTCKEKDYPEVNLSVKCTDGIK